MSFNFLTPFFGIVYLVTVESQGREPEEGDRRLTEVSDMPALWKWYRHRLRSRCQRQRDFGPENPIPGPSLVTLDTKER